MELVTIGENVRRSPIAGRTRPRITHCKHGHEFTIENTAINRKGHRQCKACARTQTRLDRGWDATAAITTPAKTRVHDPHTGRIRWS